MINLLYRILFVKKLKPFFWRLLTNCSPSIIKYFITRHQTKYITIIFTYYWFDKHRTDIELPSPIKIVSKNEKDKKDILESVKLLKYKNTSICVTEDVTWEKRLIIKEWFRKASAFFEMKRKMMMMWSVMWSGAFEEAQEPKK